MDWAKDNTITSNYYNSGSSLNFVSSDDTKLTLSDPEAVAKTSDELKALDANGTDADFIGDDNGWNAFSWEFTDGKYPSLKSYSRTVDNNTNPPTFTQIDGTLLCGQPDPDFVSVLRPSPLHLRASPPPPRLLEKGSRAFFWE